MENLNDFMPKKEDTVSFIKTRAQNLIKMKDDLLEIIKDVKVVDVYEASDMKIVSLNYTISVNANTSLLDLIVDTKNEIFKIKMLKSRIDTNFPDGLKQINMLENIASLLYESISILEIKKQSLDRIVRYYEKMSSTYT